MSRGPRVFLLTNKVVVSAAEEEDKIGGLIKRRLKSSPMLKRRRGRRSFSMCCIVLAVQVFVKSLFSGKENFFDGWLITFLLPTVVLIDAVSPKTVNFQLVLRSRKC